MDTGFSFGATVEFTKVNLKITILTDRGFTNGAMGEFIQVNGRIIKCTDKEYLHGKMAENMKENISWIRKRGKDNSFGVTEGYIKVLGKKENSMDTAFI